MYAPKLRETERSRDMIQEFRGYNHNLRIGDNEFYDMKNMTGSYYPVLSPRGKRTHKQYYGKWGETVAVSGGNNLLYLLREQISSLSYDKVYLKNFETTLCVGSTEDGNHQLISVAGQTMIYPEQIKYNQHDSTCIKIKPAPPYCDIVYKKGSSWESANEFDIVNRWPSSAQEDEVGKKVIYINEDGDYIVLECTQDGYDTPDGSGYTYQWRYIGALYVSLSYSQEDNTGITIGDFDWIEFCDPDVKVKWNLASSQINVKEKEVDEEDHVQRWVLDSVPNDLNDFKNNSSDYLKSLLKTNKGPFAFKDYSKPTFDFVIEHENRIWGARYDGAINEISASELGFYWNFISKGQKTADSPYTVSIGSDGPFTGAIVYQGHPIFFKENCYHIVYGSYPANYQVVTENGHGVQKGSDKSLCIIDGVLYYKASDGVYRFDGASHQKISEDLGFERYKDAVGGTVDGKYYIAMTDENGTRSIFVYDTRRGFWHKEDDANVLYFASYNGDLYFVEQTENGDQRIGTIKGTGDGEAEDDVEWFVETGIMGYSTPDSKYVGKLQVRLMLPVGSHVNFYIEYDSDGYMEFVGGLEGTSLQSFTLPILPRRCDHFKIRISGVGECKIFSLCKVLEDGGES